MDTSSTLTRAEKLHVLTGGIREIIPLGLFASKAWAVHLLDLLEEAEKEKANQ